TIKISFFTWDASVFRIEGSSRSAIFPAQVTPWRWKICTLIFSVSFAAQTASILRSLIYLSFLDHFCNIFRIRHGADRTLLHSDQGCAGIGVSQDVSQHFFIHAVHPVSQKAMDRTSAEGISCSC